MKKLCLSVLLFVLIVSLSACGNTTSITMQEIYDASQNEAILKNHESVCVRNETNGELNSEGYLTKDYLFYDYKNLGFNWSEFLTDEVYYDYFDGDYSRVLTISPDGVTDIASYRENYYATLLFAADTVYETIESVTKKDGRITVVSTYDQENIENKVDNGIVSGRFEYVLDGKTREVIGSSGDYTYSDGMDYHSTSEVIYDAEAPEMIKVFLDYANQTEDLRSATIVTNPGTDKEISQSFQAPKGLLVSFYSAGDFEEVFEVYTDAACTDLYDPFEDTESDLTLYVKWSK